MTHLTDTEAHAAATTALWGSALWGAGRGALYLLASVVNFLWPALVVPAERAQVYEVAIEALGGLWHIGLALTLLAVAVAVGIWPSRWRTPPRWLPPVAAAYGMAMLATAVLLGLSDPLSPAWLASALAGIAAIVAAVVVKTTRRIAGPDQVSEAVRIGTASWGA